VAAPAGVDESKDTERERSPLVLGYGVYSLPPEKKRKMLCCLGREKREPNRRRRSQGKMGNTVGESGMALH